MEQLKNQSLYYSDKGYGSLILSNNSYEIKNTIFNNLSYPKSIDKILYGGLNIINSNLRILDSEINNSNSEDAINIISSKSYIENLKIEIIVLLMQLILTLEN